MLQLLTWNTFPLPHTSEADRTAIIHAGAGLLDARHLQPDMALADLYTPAGMSGGELLDAHRELDRRVDRLFGIRAERPTNLQRQDVLFTSRADGASPRNQKVARPPLAPWPCRTLRLGANRRRAL